jgi:hypothetical protein
MRPKILDLLFHDDRMFVLEVSQAESRDGMTNALPRREWVVVTRRNVPGYPPTRVNGFPTRAQAIGYYKKVVVQTPRVSLGEKSPSPALSLESYTAWLREQELFDHILNPRGRQPHSE